MMKKNWFYLEQIENLPDGIRKTVGEILLEHQGLDRAISRKRLVEEVRRKMNRGALNHRQTINLDRTTRKAIEELRLHGWLIGSNLDGDGYYMIKDMSEFQTFQAEYTSRAYQVIETAKKLETTAVRMFGDPKHAGQMPLIEGMK